MMLRPPIVPRDPKARAEAAELYRFGGLIVIGIMVVAILVVLFFMVGLPLLRGTF